MTKNPEITSFMMQELRKANYRNIEDFNTLYDQYNALLDQIKEDGGVPIGDPHTENTPGPVGVGKPIKNVTFATTTSKKLPDPPILTDGKNPLIDDWSYL